MFDFLNLNFFLKKRRRRSPRARVKRRFNNFKGFKNFKVAQTLDRWAVAAIMAPVYGVYGPRLRGLWPPFTGSLKNKGFHWMAPVYGVYGPRLQGCMWYTDLCSKAPFFAN
jgi:hypothetical protein